MINEAIRNNVYIKVEHDPDTESPFEYDCFEFVNGFTNRDRYCKLRGELPLEDLDKTWWLLNCYRHGGEVWSLAGEGYECRFDTSHYCGLLHLPSKDPSEVGGDATAAARSVLDVYNEWVSGNCWWYRIEYAEYVFQEGTCPCCETPDVTVREDRLVEFDSCGGFIGTEHVQQEIKDALKTLFEANPYLLKGDVHVKSDSDYLETDLAHDIEDLVKALKEENHAETISKITS